VCLLALVGSKDAVALTLDWEAPPICPPSEVVEAEVERLTSGHDTGALVARATVSRAADARFRVVVDISGSATGHRELFADTCAQLAKATALIVALAANPDAAIDLSIEPIEPVELEESPGLTPEFGPRGVEPTGAAAPAPAPTLPIARRGRPQGGPRRHHPLTPPYRIELFGHVGLAQGSLPSASALGRLGGGLRLPTVSGQLSLHTTQKVTHDAEGGIGAEFSLTGAELLLCLPTLHGDLWLDACGGGRLEVLRADGHGGARAYDRKVWLPGVVLGPKASLDLAEPWRLELLPELTWLTRRPRFVVTNVDEVLFQPARITVMLSVGLGYAL